MKVTMLLADHAQIADGKLFISGAGWSFAGPGPVPCAVALIFHVPWQHTNEPVAFVLRLVDEDGHQVSQPGPNGPQAVTINGQFEAGRPPGMVAGTEMNVPAAFNVVLNLPPGRRYTWILEADGHTDESWRLAFATRQAQTAPPAPE